VLDYDGDSAEMGKNLGDDLREGKATLPLIIAMQRATAQDAQLVRQAIETGGLDRLDDVVRIVRATGSLELTKETAAVEAKRAMDALVTFPDSVFKQALIELGAQLLVRRT
jgi:octaprenyl-diphosphate synthase